MWESDPKQTRFLTRPAGQLRRLVLIHGVGLQAPKIFGVNPSEVVRELKLSQNPEVIAVDWHSTVEPPSEVPFLYSGKHMASLMRGLIGSAWRGNCHLAPFYIVEVWLMLFPFVAWIALTNFMQSVEHHLGHSAIPHFAKAGTSLITGAISWLLPPLLVSHSWSITVAYGVITCSLLVLMTLYCASHNGIAEAIRSTLLAFVRPVAFFLGLACHPGGLLFLLVSIFIRGSWAGVNLSSIVTIRVDSIHGLMPSLPESVGAQAYKQYFYSVVGVCIAFGLLVLLLEVISPPLKILSDIACFLGDREYHDTLLRQVSERVNLTQFKAGDILILVGHSLGSVIALEWLLENFSYIPNGVGVRLITMGSPLRRFIARFFAGVCPSPELSVLRLLTVLKDFQWLNIYRTFDPIGGRLFKTASPCSRDVCTGDKMIGMRAHQNYWEDRRVAQFAYAFLREASDCQSQLTDESVVASAEGSHWTASERGIDFNRALLERAGIAGAVLVAGALTICAAFNVFHAMDAEDPPELSSYRPSLKRLGAPVGGWLFEVDSLESFSSDFRDMLMVKQYICAFPSGRDRWQAFAISSVFHNYRWDMSVLEKDPWRRSFQDAKADSDATMLDAKRWPIHVTYMKNTPSIFDIEELPTNGYRPGEERKYAVGFAFLFGALLFLACSRLFIMLTRRYFGVSKLGAWADKPFF